MENMFVFVLDYSSATAHRYAFAEAVCQECIEDFLSSKHDLDNIYWMASPYDAIQDITVDLV